MCQRTSIALRTRAVGAIQFELQTPKRTLWRPSATRTSGHTSSCRLDHASGRSARAVSFSTLQHLKHSHSGSCSYRLEAGSSRWSATVLCTVGTQRPFLAEQTRPSGRGRRHTQPVVESLESERILSSCQNAWCVPLIHAFALEQSINGS